MLAVETEYRRYGLGSTLVKESIRRMRDVSACAEIVLETKMEMDLDAMEMPGGMSVESAKASGKVTIDRRTGLPKVMNMDMTMLMDGPMAMEMVMKLSMKPAPAEKKAPITGPKKDAAEKGAKKKDTSAVCVISGKDAEGGPTATFAFQTVAFCCERCKAKWDKMDDASRSKAILKRDAGK